MQTTSKCLPNNLINTHSKSQKIAETENESVANLTSDTPKARGQEPSTFLLENNRLCIEQQGLKLFGQCQIDLGHQAILIATSGDLVLATQQLNCIDTSVAENCALGNQSNVNFSMTFDLDLLRKILHQNINFTLFNITQRILLSVPISDLIIEALGENRDIESIAPSYGFFGGGKNEPLKVEVEKALSSLTLTVEEKQGFLNLRGLKLFDGQDNIIPIEMMSVTCSSTTHADPYSKKLLQGNGFHSKKEDNPWLTVTFDSSTFIKRVEVANRRDKFGIRAQKLRIHGRGIDQNEWDFYAPYFHDNIANFLLKTIDLIGTRFLEIRPEQDRREAVLDQLIAVQENIPQTKESVFFALNYISSWSASLPEPNLHNKELKILAAYLFENTKTNMHCPLMPFIKILPFTSNVDFLEDAFNELRAKNELPLIKFTKHGIAKQGMLVQNVPKVIKTLQTVMQDLEEMGLRPCLAYGTLLGAYREKHFIAHDDDVDILIEFPEENLTRQQAFAKREKLLQKLDYSKYRISTEKVKENLNIHLILKETNIMIDVFPYWHENGKDSLHMEKMAVRGISSDILAERTEIELEGEMFPAPGDIEGFLLERYGETWHISDKFHEWRWPIKSLPVEDKV